MKHTLVFHLIGLSKKFQRAIGSKSKTNPLSYSQTAALLVLDSLPFTNQIEISRRLHLQPASIVTLVDELEKMKLVERKSLPSDRRTYQILLTESGKSEAESIRQQSMKVEQFVKKQLTREEFQLLTSIVEKLSESLDNNNSTPEKSQGKEVQNGLSRTKRNVEA